MRTFRSRGSDISAIAFFDASSRIRIIVSERAPPPASRAPFARLSEPIRSTVCGWPGSACASGLSTWMLPWKALAMRSTWWMPSTVVALALARIMTSAPSRKRFQIPRLSGRSGNAQVGGAEPLRDRVDEVDERLAVVTERLDRDPLVGAVVARADRPELDARGARLEEADDVGRAVAADRDVLGRHRATDALGQEHHVRIVALDDRGVAVEHHAHLGVGQGRDLV